MSEDLGLHPLLQKMADLQGLFDPEPLDPELARYLVDVSGWSQVLRHPLVEARPYFPPENKRLNLSLQAKRLAVEASYNAGDWWQYVFWHERYHRIHAFMDITDDMTPAEYWKTLGAVWTDNEQISDHYDDWLSLWQDDRPERLKAMTDTERSALHFFHDTLTVYRGVGHEDAVTGLSWTLDRSKGEWFAYRSANITDANRAPHLAIGTAKKADVLAYFTRRDESEVVIDPENVEITDVITLPPKPRRA